MLSSIINTKLWPEKQFFAIKHEPNTVILGFKRVKLKFCFFLFPRSRRRHDNREPSPVLPPPLLPVLRLPRPTGVGQQGHGRQGQEQQAALPELLLKRRRWARTGKVDGCL